jgi:hypothetical protein
MDMNGFFLNGLADDIGLEAGLVRQAVLTIASEAVINATTEQNLVLKQGTSEISLIALPLYSGTGDYPTSTVKPHEKHIGGILKSSYTDMLGFDIVMHTEGADDDGFIKMTIDGVLPDGESLTLGVSSGQSTIQLPNQAITERFQITIEHSLSSAVNVMLTGIVAPPSEESSYLGSEQLEKAGVPVGKSWAALKGLVADMIESHSAAKEESAVKISALAKSGDRAGLRHAMQQRKTLGRRALIEAGQQDYGDFAKIGGVIANPNQPSKFASRFGGRRSFVQKLMRLAK